MVSFEDELKSIIKIVDELSVDLVKWTLKGLDNDLIRDINSKTLVNFGETAIPGICSFLVEQAQLEKELVNDLLKYYYNQDIFRTNRYHIVTKRTIPQYLSPIENVYAVEEVEENFKREQRRFLTRWKNDPEEFTGYSNPKPGPNRTCVEGAIWALEVFDDSNVVPLLNGLVEQVEAIKQMEVPNCYCSVFTRVYEALDLIKKANY